MKLQTRLTLLVTVIILSTSTAIGYFSVSTSYSNQLKNSDQVISTTIQELSNSKDNPLSLSTYLAEISNLKFSVAYITQENDLIPLHDGNSSISTAPDKSIIYDAQNKAITLNQSRIRSYQFSDGEFLLLHYSIEEIESSKNQNIRILFIFTTMLIFISAFITFILFRKDTQLNLLVNSLRKSQENMREFIGDASHELKTPLTVIRGYFELIFNNKSSPTQNMAYQKRIESEIFRMQSIIEDLLFIAELDEQRINGDLKVDISSHVEVMVNDLRHLQPNRVVDSSIEPNLFIRISYSHLSQLLANISSNISRHTPEDSLVNIKLFKCATGVRLLCEDSGPGLPANFYKNGIQAFRRFDKSRSRESGGSGLGMTIMEKIVKKNGGKIELSQSRFGGLKIEIDFLPFTK